MCSFFMQGLIALLNCVYMDIMPKVLSYLVTYVAIAYLSVDGFNDYGMNNLQLATVVCVIYNIISLPILSFMPAFCDKIGPLVQLYSVWMIQCILLSFAYEWDEYW